MSRGPFASATFTLLLLLDGTHAYTHGPTGLLAAHDLDTDETLYPVADQVGSVRAWVDDTGAVQGRADYTTFGERTTDGIVLPFGFAGEYHDDPSGLLHLRARYYDPQLAIFTTVDPLVDATRDPYGYAAGDPTLLTDPSGEIPLLAVAAVAGGIIGGGTSLVTGYLDGQRGSDLVEATLIGAVGGTIQGACYGVGAVWAASVCGGAAAFTTSAIGSVARTGQVDYKSAGFAGVAGAFGAAIPSPVLNGKVTAAIGGQAGLTARTRAAWSMNARPLSDNPAHVAGEFYSLSGMSIPIGWAAIYLDRATSAGC